MERDDFYNNYSSCTVSAAECKCFDQLTEEQQKFLDNNSVLITYKKNETINKQGALVSHVMYMEEGLAKVYMSNKDENLLLKLIPPKNFIGLVAASESENVYHYSSMAYVESKIRQIEVSAFRKLLDDNSGFAKEIINILSANSIQIYNRFFVCLKNIHMVVWRI
jgi:CRP-like cAMP-binding protein